MARFSGQCSIMQEIKKTEETITLLERRVDDLEYDLETKDVSTESREKLETELVEIRELLTTNKQMLSTLHKHNMKSFSFAVILICGFFTLYILYIIIAGLDY